MDKFVQSFTYYYYSFVYSFDRYVTVLCLISIPKVAEEMKAIVKMDVELTVEERNLVSIWYIKM